MTEIPPASVPNRVLIVDDDEAVLRSLERALRSEGFDQLLLCSDAREVAGILGREQVGVMLLDLGMPHVSGEEVLGLANILAPETAVIIVTAVDRVDVAVRCIQAGAFDYLVKPVELTRLVATVLRAFEHCGLKTENRELRRRVASPALKHPEAFADIITQSPVMYSLFSYAEAVAPSCEPVLVVGETGVGKERVVGALHRASGRAGPLVAVNVASLDDVTLADALFGHGKGAFTGAVQTRPGLVEQAGGGTLFLDEIGDLSLDSQTKLLRLLQEHEYYPIGVDRPRRSTCRIVAATNRDLPARVKAGRFREDLFYRLHAHVVRVPPLRERMEDLAPLLEHFLAEASAALGKPKPTPPRELLTYLAGYLYPGNVRELRAMVVDAVAQHGKGVLSLRSFLAHIEQATTADLHPPQPADGGPDIAFGKELPTLKSATSLLFTEALRRADGNQSAAARLLGISRRTMNRYFTSGLVGTLPSTQEDAEDEPNP